jgi:hypothetical protein
MIHIGQLTFNPQTDDLEKIQAIYAKYPIVDIKIEKPDFIL